MNALRDFETSIIAKFISAKDKLLKMALLNKKWSGLIKKHYCWACFPVPGPYSLISDFITFFDSFH